MLLEIEQSECNLSEQMGETITYYICNQASFGGEVRLLIKPRMYEQWQYKHFHTLINNNNNNNIIMKVFIKHRILSIVNILSTYMHTHTHTHTHTQTHTHTHTHTHTLAPTHMSILTIQNLIYTQLKTGSKQSLETDEDSSVERKAWRCDTNVQFKTPPSWQVHIWQPSLKVWPGRYISCPTVQFFSAAMQPTSSQDRPERHK